jgi:hypothetical protein
MLSYQLFELTAADFGGLLNQARTVVENWHTE